MIVEIKGYRKTKYGYEVYAIQKTEREEQLHNGLKTYTAYSKEEPELNTDVNMIFYSASKKFYIIM